MILVFNQIKAFHLFSPQLHLVCMGLIVDPAMQFFSNMVDMFLIFYLKALSHLWGISTQLEKDIPTVGFIYWTMGSLLCCHLLFFVTIFVSINPSSCKQQVAEYISSWHVTVLLDLCLFIFTHQKIFSCLKRWHGDFQLWSSGLNCGLLFFGICIFVVTMLSIVFINGWRIWAFYIWSSRIDS